MEQAMLSTIIWGVFWFVIAPWGYLFTYFTPIFLGGLIGYRSKDRNDEGLKVGASVGFIFGILLTILWELFVIVQIAIHVVTLIQLLTN
jgi:hypothetical protein